MSEIFRPPELDERLTQDDELMRVHALLSRLGPVVLRDVTPLVTPPKEHAPHRVVKWVATMTVRHDIQVSVVERDLAKEPDPVTLFRSAVIVMT